MVVCKLPYRGKSRKGGSQTPLRCARNAAFCKPFASAAGSRPYRRRKAGAPVGGASASDGANALSAKDGVSVYGQARLQKCEKNGFCKRTSRARRGRNASVKGMRKPPQDGTARFCGRRRAKPRSLPYPFYAKSPRGPSYPSRAILCAIKKDAGRTARRPRRTEKRRQKRAGRSGRPLGTASAGRTRRTAETAASGGVSPAPRQSAASRWTGKTDVFRPVRLVKEGAFSKPLRGRGFPRLLRKAERKGTKPAPAASEAGSASPKRARVGRRSAPAGLPTGQEPPPLPPACGRTACFTAIAKDVFRPCFSLF